jgi:ATP-dependent DNA ligase
MDANAHCHGADEQQDLCPSRRRHCRLLSPDKRLPLQLTPVTYDLDEAQEWFKVLPAALGTEGLVLKPTSSRYVGGRRTDWAKVNSVGVGPAAFFAA